MIKARKYSISFSKDIESEEYVTRIEQDDTPGGINIRTPYKEQESIIWHLEEIKDILELKITSYYEKLRKNESKA